MKEFFFDQETNTVVAGGRSATELEDDLCLDDHYADMFGVCCSLDNFENSNNQKVMQFDLPKQLNLELITDSNNILADDNGSTATALTDVSTVTQNYSVEEVNDDNSITKTTDNKHKSTDNMNIDNEKKE